jgi:hypothetical protein
MLVGLLVTLTIVIVLVTLAVAPGLAERVYDMLSNLREKLTAIAQVFLGAIQSWWSMKGRQDGESKWATKRLNREVVKRAQKLRIPDTTIADAMALPLSTSPSQIGNQGSMPGYAVSQVGVQTPLPGYAPGQTGLQLQPGQVIPQPTSPGNQLANVNTPTLVPQTAQLGLFQRIGHFFFGERAKGNGQPQDPQAEIQTRADGIKRVLSIRKQVADEYGLEIEEKQTGKKQRGDGADADVIEVWQAKPPSNLDMVTAWSMRFVYIVLVLVCVAADYVFTSSRAPTVIGGGSFTPPPFLQGLFQYLPVITGVLFVAIAALSGMLIDEFAMSHSNYIKIWPYIANALRIIGLILAIVMFVVDVIAVISLVIVGFAFQESIGLPLYSVLIVLVSIAIIIALGVLLAFPGLWQGLAALGLLFFGGVAALFFYALALVVVVLGAIVALLAEINRLITGRQKRQGSQGKVSVDTRNLALVGYGSVGSDWVINVGNEFASLYGDKIWLLGTNETDSTHVRSRTAVRQRLRAHDVSAPNSGGIVQNLTNSYSGKRQDEVKPLLWIVRDMDLGKCLDELQSLGAQVTNSRADFKNVQLVLFWILSQGATNNPDIQDLAQDLSEWAARPGSMLKTTIIYEVESPAKRWGDMRDPLFKRGLAALLGAGFSAPESSFAAAATGLHNSGYTFSYLAAGSIGVVPAQQNFQMGFVSGRTGEINPINASRRMGFLAGEVLKEQTCSTVPDKAMANPGARPKSLVPNDPAYKNALEAWQASQKRWLNQQANVFVNIVVPTERKALKREQRERFQSLVCEWMRDDYGVYEQHVTVVTVGSDKDPGIDVKDQWPLAEGDYYFSLTVLRGASDERSAVPAIPENLQGGTADAARLAKLDEWYGSALPSGSPNAPMHGQGTGGSGNSGPNGTGDSPNGAVGAGANPAANIPAGNMGGYAPYAGVNGGAGAPDGAGNAPPPLTPYFDPNATVNLYPNRGPASGNYPGTAGTPYPGATSGNYLAGKPQGGYPDQNPNANGWYQGQDPDQQNGSEQGS